MINFRRLFGKIRPGTHTLMNIDEAHKVVRGYANFMAVSSPLPGCVADIERLPYPKHQIKEAIRICLEISSDTRLKKELAYGFLMLSAWQEGIGADILVLDFTGINLNEAPLQVAENIQRHYDKIRHWKPIVENEHSSLEKELEGLLVETQDTTCRSVQGTSRSL